MKKRALLITMKNPVLGKVKTRLAASLGHEKALEIYHFLLRHTREVALLTVAARYLYYSDFVDEMDEWPGSDFIKKIQSGKDIGQRMARCFEEVMPAYEMAVLIGCDIPGLSAGILENAFNKLEDHDFVIGPAEDGGYYLIGMKKFYPAVFEGIAWSTPAVFEATLNRINALGKSWACMERLMDVDDVGDWERYNLQHY